MYEQLWHTAAATYKECCMKLQCSMNCTTLWKFFWGDGETPKPKYSIHSTHARHRQGTVEWQWGETQTTYPDQHVMLKRRKSWLLDIYYWWIITIYEAFAEFCESQWAVLKASITVWFNSLLQESCSLRDTYI